MKNEETNQANAGVIALLLGLWIAGTVLAGVILPDTSSAVKREFTIARVVGVTDKSTVVTTNILGLERQYTLPNTREPRAVGGTFTLHCHPKKPANCATTPWGVSWLPRLGVSWQTPLWGLLGGFILLLVLVVGNVVWEFFGPRPRRRARR